MGHFIKNVYVFLCLVCILETQTSCLKIVENETMVFVQKSVSLIFMTLKKKWKHAYIDKIWLPANGHSIF